MQNVQWILIAVMAVLVVGGLVWTQYRARRRRDALRQVAGELGLSFEERADALVAELGGRIRLFGRGRRRRVRNLMRGAVEDLRVFVLDYAYTTGSGKNSSTWRQTVVAIELIEGVVTDFEIRPEGLFHKIGSKLGYQDIDLPEHPTFSSRYLLRGPNEVAIRAALSPDVVERLVAGRNLCVEASGRWVVIYRARRRVRPENIAAFLDEAFSVCNRLTA